MLFDSELVLASELVLILVVTIDGIAVGLHAGLSLHVFGGGEVTAELVVVGVLGDGDVAGVEVEICSGLPLLPLLFMFI